MANIPPRFDLNRTLDREAAQQFDSFARAGQGHVFGFWNALADEARVRLVDRLRQIDLARVADLARLVDSRAKVALSGFRPPACIEPPVDGTADDGTASAIVLGEQALRDGKIGVLLVAGGQASRLGIDRPKGCLAFGPVTGRSLFQLFAEQIAAAEARYGRSIPWLIMTSEATHADTVGFFDGHGYFGLDPAQVTFFPQGMLPAMDAAGRLLLAAEDEPFLSPDGHGGMLRALREHGLIDALHDAGIETLSYFQVDNPQVRILDPLFFGLHRRERAEFSVKVVPKVEPEEKVGLVIERADGRVDLIEYSALGDADAQRRDADGRLTYRAGNTAIHVIDLAFIDRITRPGSDLSLPVHVAHKHVPHLAADAASRGERAWSGAESAEPNAFKFEQFIFDALPLAERCVVLQVDRDGEFLPIKSATGPTSPEAVSRDYQRYWATELRRAGVPVATDAGGVPLKPLEVSPRFLLDRAPYPTLAARATGRPADDAYGTLVE